MTFTYDLSNGFSDLERVRFHIGDTVSSAARFSDEEINAITTEFGSWQAAVIACLEFIVTKLSEPNFRADWLQVDLDTGRKSYEALLERKRLELSQADAPYGGKHVFRKDSYLTEEPTYDTDSNPWEESV